MSFVLREPLFRVSIRVRISPSELVRGFKSRATVASSHRSHKHKTDVLEIMVHVGGYKIRHVK